MGDTFMNKLVHARTKFFRRSSAFSEPPSSPDNRASTRHQRALKPQHRTSFPELPAPDQRSLSTAVDGSELPEPASELLSQDPAVTKSVDDRRESVVTDRRQSRPKVGKPPILTVQEPSPDLKPVVPDAAKGAQAGTVDSRPPSRRIRPPPTPTPLSRTVSSNPQSPAARTNSTRSRPPTTPHTKDTEYDISGEPKEKETDYFGPVAVEDFTRKMSRKRIWIRRPGASATQVQMSEDDLVDDLRDMIIRKYSNALGKTYDAPDITLRVIPRTLGPGSQERALGPDESLCRIVDGFFPGGQTVDEALLIDVPARRTPRPSPGLVRPTYLSEDVHHPLDESQGYFPPMPLAGTHISSDSRVAFHNPSHPHAMSVLETGQLPALPSPRAKGSHRPGVRRQRTASPTILTGSPGAAMTLPQARHHRRLDSGSGLCKPDSHAPIPPPLPTPPASDLAPTTITGLSTKATTPPLDRVSSPRSKPSKKRTKTSSSSSNAHTQPPPSLPAGMLNGSVPPINVLIVEDNIINLKLLEAFVKRLKVRWATAMNGREAVEKWRSGGFHLVLMDIQLPIMNGLQATKEIRRLERLNGIGVFAKSEAEDHTPQLMGVNGDGEIVVKADRDSKSSLERPEGEDKLAMLNLFKSPVIIVALTASSLQSDRHEALAAGCNDFLTKPVNFVWFERKVMEWGCMQALIDFDGWRQWKNFGGEGEGGTGSDAEKAKEKELTPAEKEKREKKEARRAAILAKMGQA